MTDVMIGLAVTLAAGVAVGYTVGRLHERWRRPSGTVWPIVHLGNETPHQKGCLRVPRGTYDLLIRRRFVRSEPSP